MKLNITCIFFWSSDARWHYDTRETVFREVM